MKKQFTVSEILSALAPSMAALVLFEGLIVIAGWIFNIDYLKNPFPEESAVAMSSGFCFVLTAVSILAKRAGKQSLTMATALISFAIASIICSHYLFNTFDLDRVILGVSSLNVLGPGRMSPTILFSFWAVNLATLINREKHTKAIDVLLLFENVLCLTALAAHYFEVPNLMRIKTIIQMSTPTAVAGLLMSWALLFLRSDLGMVSVFSREGASGKFIRHFLLPAILVPLLVGKVSLIGFQSGTYDVKMGTALVVLFVICFLISAIWNVAGWLDVAEQERKEAQEEAIRNAESTKLIVDVSPDAFSMIDTDGKLLEWNPAAEALFGWTREEILGKVFDLIIVESERNTHLSHVSEYEKTGYMTVLNSRLEINMLRKDGTEFPAECTPFEIKTANGSRLGAFMHDISARKEAEQRINEFVSTVSHELRTPLTSIKGALRLIEGGIAGDVSSEALSLVNVASTETERLIRIVNDILDLKKIEAGKLELKFADVEVGVLVECAVEGILGMAREYGVELLKCGDGSNGFINCDKDRIIQVLHNLISNAIKFSPEGETVRLEISATDAHFRFAVRDNGSGIPESQMHKLFGRFQQLDSSDTRQQGGTGLGLAISKAIIEEHKGTIGFSSAIGEGSTFWFLLPAISIQEAKSETDSNLTS